MRELAECDGRVAVPLQPPVMFDANVAAVDGVRTVRDGALSPGYLASGFAEHSAAVGFAEFDVLAERDEPHVGRVAAQPMRAALFAEAGEIPVVAVVLDRESVGDGAVSEFPGEPVSADGACVAAQLPVTVAHGLAEPGPAPVRPGRAVHVGMKEGVAAALDIVPVEPGYGERVAVPPESLVVLRAEAFGPARPDAVGDGARRIERRGNHGGDLF